MEQDLSRAQKLLTAEGCTCVLCKQDQVYKSCQRGVLPLRKRRKGRNRRADVTSATTATSAHVCRSVMARLLSSIQAEQEGDEQHGRDQKRFAPEYHETQHRDTHADECGRVLLRTQPLL